MPVPQPGKNYFELSPEIVAQQRLEFFRKEFISKFTLLINQYSKEVDVSWLLAETIAQCKLRLLRVNGKQKAKLITDEAKENGRKAIDYRSDSDRRSAQKYNLLDLWGFSMSDDEWKTYDWLFKRRSDRLREKMIYIMIARNIKDKKNFTLAELAKELKISKTRVQQVISSLERQNLLRRIGGRYLTNGASGFKCELKEYEENI